MITVICKKIDSGKDPSGGLESYARDLLAYMTNPERQPEPGATEKRQEKCVAVVAKNFSCPMPPVKQMAAEFVEDAALSRRVKGPISHWVMSWKCTAGEDPPSETDIFNSIGYWLDDMGYGGDGFKVVIAIHKDTDNVHAHMAVSRVDGLTGAVPDRPWWKNDNQKALAEIAGAFGWDVEKGARFRPKKDKKDKPISKTVSITHPITGKKEEKTVCAIEAKKSDKSAPHPGDKAERLEHYTGIKSQKRMLQDRLSEAYDSMEAELPAMKWGQIHQRLAQFGIQMERREHKPGQFGIVFSLDGEHWHSASTVCPEMTWPKLNGNIGAKKDSWRNASKDLLPVLEEARKRYAEVEPTRKSIDTVFQKLSKEEIDVLRSIPMDEARAALEKAGVKLIPGGKAKNAIDVAVKEGKLAFPQAVKKLAELFPDRIEALRKETKGETDDPQILIPAWWQALQLDHVVYQRRFYSLKAFIEIAPSMEGWADLFWAAQERALQKTFQTDFCQSYPPSCILDTPTGPRAFWVVEQKYPEEQFYKDFEKYLEALPKETIGLPPITRVISSTPRRPIEMEALIDSYRTQWLREKAGKGKREETKPAPWTVADLQKVLKFASVPRWMKEYGQQIFSHLKAEAQAPLSAKEASKLSKEMIRLLYRAGGRPAEIYAFMNIFMVRHSKKLKDLGLVDYDPAAGPEYQRKYEAHQKATAAIHESIERQVKTLTAQLAPKFFLENRTIWREKPGGFRLDCWGFLVPFKAKDSPMPLLGAPIPFEIEKKRMLERDILMRPVGRDILMQPAPAKIQPKPMASVPEPAGSPRM